MRNKFRVRKIDLEAGKFFVVLNFEDAQKLGLYPQDRVKITHNGKTVTGIVEISKSMISEGEVGCYLELCESLSLKGGEEITITPTSRPISVEYIKKKIEGKKLSREEIEKIVEDIVLENLSDIELTAYITSVMIHGMDMDEITALTESMVKTGETIDFEYPIFDVHSIGGVPGNKYAPIAVSIGAANGLKIPKTSSRAISSACGTADLMEVLTNVELSPEEIKKVVNEVGATLVWGGSINLAPADDKIIRVEYPLSVDPKPQLLASVMAKKKAVGADYVVIDIPVGKEAKVKNMKEARDLAMDFIKLGERLGMRVECAITYGGQPIGRAIGPALEAREVLMILENNPPSTSIVEKSLEIAGLLLELGGLAWKGQGKDLARNTLRSGKAREKFLEIINAQGSKNIEKSEDVPVGKYTYDILAPTEGYVGEIHNSLFVKIARIAGAPKDKGAGIYLHKKKGDKVDENEPLFTIYSNSKHKLEMAVEFARRNPPAVIEGMLLERIPSFSD